MNKYLTIAILALTFIYGCGSSNAQTQTDNVQETTVTFIVDCSDADLFESINQDFHSNLNTFFQESRLGLNRLEFGQKLTVKMAPILESGEFSSKKASIALTNRKISKREESALRDTKPLLQLIRTELDAYKTLSESNMNSSPIIETLLKAFKSINTEANLNIVVALTDGIEHSSNINMYRSTIPTTDEAIDKIVNKLDPILWQDAANSINKAAPPIVIVVLKKSEKAKASDLKQFYSKLFVKLGIRPSNIVFLDNLGNNFNLQKP